MNVNFKKLLPKILQSTRWGEYVEAVQTVLEDVKENKIDIIRDRYLLDNMSDTDYVDITSELGYAIKSYSGYSSTSEYKKRQLYTVIPRTTYKNSYKGYDYISFIYNLNSEVYPMYYSESALTPYLYWDESSESDEADYILDRAADNGSSVYMSSGGPIIIYESPKNSGLAELYLDTPLVWESLDQENIIDQLTRHILYSYKFKTLEDSSNFISESTAQALYYDISQHKRKTEIIYYEPYLEIETGTTSGELTLETYYSIDRLSSGSVLSRFYPYVIEGEQSYDLTSGSIVRFGNGNWGESYLTSGEPTDVNSYLFQVELSSGSISSGETSSGECTIYSWTPDELDFRKTITQKNMTVDTFSELCILDISSSCIYYSEFPTVGFYDKMYTNVALKINLI